MDNFLFKYVYLAPPGEVSKRNTNQIDIETYVLTFAHPITKVVDLSREPPPADIRLPLCDQRLKDLIPIALTDQLHTVSIGLTASGVTTAKSIKRYSDCRHTRL